MTDIVDSTKLAARVGDARWRELLDEHDAVVRAQLGRERGRLIDTTGDGAIATFDSPARAIRCACAIRDALLPFGIDMRAGLHTGEIDITDGSPRGIALHIASRIVDLAQASEVLVSQTVKDLVTGAKLSFRTRGTHSLRGVPGKWHLYALSEPGRREPRKPPAKPRGISLLIVDDHPIWRQSLRQVIEVKKAGAVIGEASDGGEAIELARRLKPEVVVMDMDLPKTNGIEATKEILNAQPDVKVLFLSASDTREKVLDAVEAGASGYLLKTAEPDEIVDAVRRIHAGEAVFAPSLAGAVLDEFRRLSAGGPRKRKPIDALSARETEVLKLMAEGRSNQAISDHLHLARKTVEAHVASIFAKLGLEEAPDDHRRVLAVVTYLRSV